MPKPITLGVTTVVWYSPATPPDHGRLVWIAVDEEVHPAVFEADQFGWFIAAGPRERDYVRQSGALAWTDNDGITLPRMEAGFR